MVSTVISDYRNIFTAETSDYRNHGYNCNKWISLPWLQL